jgi:hypothetical protein
VGREKLIAPLLFGLAFISVLSCQQRPTVQSGKPQSFVERCAKDEDVVVRFYYNPLVHGEGTAHAPLILIPVSSQDPRLGTRPAWILYITLPDLRKALHVLADPQLLWKESLKPKQLVVDPFDLPEPHHDSMEIAVTSTQGSATAEIGAKRACDLLSDISNAVTNARARDSLAFYRRTVSCLPPET